MIDRKVTDFEPMHVNLPISMWIGLIICSTILVSCKPKELPPIKKKWNDRELVSEVQAAVTTNSPIAAEKRIGKLADYNTERNADDREALKTLQLDVDARASDGDLPPIAESLQTAMWLLPSDQYRLVGIYWGKDGTVTFFRAGVILP